MAFRKQHVFNLTIVTLCVLSLIFSTYSSLPAQTTTPQKTQYTIEQLQSLPDSIWLTDEGLEALYELQEIEVSSKLDLERLVRQIARNFTAKYQKNYVSQVLHYRTVMTNETYCEFNGYQGINASLDFNQLQNMSKWENPGNTTYFAPMTVMRSFSFDKDSTTLKYIAVNLPDQDITRSNVKDRREINYNNHPSKNILMFKRSLEIFSPLNIKQLKNYRYSLERFYNDSISGNQMVKIFFSTKPNAFPEKTPLYIFNGILTYNITRRVLESIEVSNYLDLYSNPYDKTVRYTSLASDFNLTIEYRLEEKTLYNSSVTLSTSWRSKREPDSYSIISNSRANPAKRQLKEYERFEFHNFIELNKPESQRIKSMLSYLDMNILYCAFYKTDEWKTFQPKDSDSIINTNSSNNLDLHKLYKDLHRGQLTLEMQARRKGMSGYEMFWTTLPAHPERSKRMQTSELKFPHDYFLYTRDYIFNAIFFNRSKGIVLNE